MKLTRFKWQIQCITAVLVLICFAGRPPAVLLNDAQPRSVAADSIREIPKVLPAVKNSFIQKAGSGKAPAGFKLRGTKGWSWTPEQYLQEIPVLAQYKMNFLMNCYISMFSTPLPADSAWISPVTRKMNTDNKWWLPIPRDKKQAYEQVFKKSDEYGISFCFGIHPQLSSSRPADLSDEKDFEAIWQHYAWAQSKGVRWFSLPLDDVTEVRIDGKEHARFVNKLLNRLRRKDRDAQMIFCPTYYYPNPEVPEHKQYIDELAAYLDESVYVFWTGKSVLPSVITKQEAETFKNLVRHRVILWDNFPTNDAGRTLHLAPITGRGRDLHTVIDGYMSNPFFTENEINRIPLFTQADYAYDPLNYNPEHSIAQAILHQTEKPEERNVLLDLVNVYASHINTISVRFNPVSDRFKRIASMPFSRHAAEQYILHLKAVEQDMRQVFPGRYHATKKTFSETIKLVEKEYQRIYF